MSAPASKKAKLDPDYELLYWPGLPGRGEFIRIAFEAAGVPYTDVSNTEENGMKQKLLPALDETATSVHDGLAPIFAPPALKVLDVDGKPLLICQTPNILLYIGDHHGLAPSDSRKYIVHGYALGALDLTKEAHDAHHPVGVKLYYEDQKEEALRYADQFKKLRITKFFNYFDRCLTYNEENGGGNGQYLVGDKLTYADTTVWQAVDGVTYAFPNAVKKLRDDGQYKKLFAFYDALKEETWLKEYLASSKRLKYGDGIFRYYKELDD